MAKHASVEAYLDTLDPARRDVVDAMRATARAAAPEADEVFPWNPFVIAEVGEAALAPYMAGRGTIQFPSTKPVPLDLVRRVVEARVRELRAKAEGPA